MIILLTFVLSLFFAPQESDRPQRFDRLVRADFFAGLAGDDVRLGQAIERCERALDINPKHAVQNYERVFEIQAPIFATLGDHPKGELLFGLADGWNRLGDHDKARRYFDRLIADAPTSGQVPKAREWMASGTVPKSSGASCVGCHK